MIWFTADLHLGHRNIIEYEKRPAADLLEHDAMILQGISETVGADDALYVLGDVSFASMRKYKAALSALPGRRYLVAGNHDSVWHGNPKRKQSSEQRFLDAGFAEINDGELGNEWKLSYEALGWPGVGYALLSHFPTFPESDKEDQRFAEHRPQYSGIVLCGHIHSAWTVRDKCINVGVDVWGYKPVSAQTLLDTLTAQGVDLTWPSKR